MPAPYQTSRVPVKVQLPFSAAQLLLATSEGFAPEKFVTGPTADVDGFTLRL
ncbi:Uncharacterised protein [Mycobacterium tuberculosis]|nr:Uncharacterised protein [Mycobacterium tuberculosis]